ncbi:MAG: mandelate racemase/muconate lactonizing enzyme family protein [Acetobacteraceae bacterium]|nr:mandelate racemase/muconate lactonizing enzyme family protein [Acetobacteraceae bacterium]
MITETTKNRKLPRKHLSMKITRIETRIHRSAFTYGVGLDANGGNFTATGGNLRLKTMDTLLVKVETEAGVHGWGEGFGFTLVDTTRDALDRLIAPACIGQDAVDIGALNRMLQKRFHNFGRNGSVTFGISAIDIALWDIAGKIAGKPLHVLLGNAGRDKVRAYASLLRYGNPADVARNAAEAVRRGYRDVKLHEIDLACIRAARGAVPSDIPLMLDINCAWDGETDALDFCEAVKDLGVAWVEEPTWPPEDHMAMARVRAASPCAIAAGENASNPEDFCRMIEAGAAGILQPSVTKVGGLTAMLEVAELAQGAGLRVVPHCPYFGPGLLASLHFLAAMETAEPLEIYFADLEKPPFGPHLVASNGEIAVPKGPGLGLEPVW